MCDTDVELKPRIEMIPDVSDRALRLFEESLVWDAILPWVPEMNAPDIDHILPRFHAAGVNFASLTLAARFDTRTAFANIARTKAQVRAQSDYLVEAATVAEIDDARAGSRLAVGFNFQDTMPFGIDLDNVQAFYELGVRQVGLAYNGRNFVGDGCAEPDDAGLSLFGRELIAEMNRVGMLVDGTHAGYRTSMEAIELSRAPFIFSHSNPSAIFGHYRNIKDDQIKACAATGGVIGINGVGYFVGDVDAPTEAIFRCLDYTVELVGVDHVGLGFDYVYDLDVAIQWVRLAPLIWPPYEGTAMPMHNYAGPEQMVELVELMVGHGYADEAITAILGGNWRRVADAVWK